MRVAVIGGGLVGTCCGVSLAEGGAEVTVIDPGANPSSASLANVGSISTGSFIPLAGPDVLKQAIGSMMNPSGALRLGLGHAATALPWLVQFSRQARPDRVAASVEAMAKLLAPAFEAYEAVLGAAAYAELFRREGQLYVYRSLEKFAHDAASLELRRRHGVPHEVLDAQGVAELEPRLSGAYQRGVLFPQAGHVVSPLGLMNALGARLALTGAHMLRTGVRALELTADGKPEVVTTDGLRRRFDVAVIAAGAWSAELAAMVGGRLPVESLRGYALDFDQAPLRLPTLFVAEKIFATPMDFGLRVGGVADLMGLRRKPDWSRATAVAAQASKLIEGLDGDPKHRWMGHRPTTPDSTPIIGRLPKTPSVFVATGHGQTGLMTAAVTGRLMADLALDRRPGIDPRPYRPDRF